MLQIAYKPHLYYDTIISKEKDSAHKAKQFTVSKLRSAKKIELRKMQSGKYFRIVADVYIDNKNLTTMLIDNKFGIKYNGKKKNKNWCK